ncbi:MAG: SIMPL domain-containing protein [Prevotella sp.]|jgi:uncharacterized protein YggE|nr:SIMPL domain-containing protein [Prevotella sp.]
MMKRILTLYIFSCAVIGLAAQATLGGFNYNEIRNYNNLHNAPASKAVIANNDEIIINVDGLMNVAASNYVAVFNVVQIGESLEEIDKMMNDRINTFKERLRLFNISESNIKVDLVSFVPRYDIQTESKLFSKSYNEIPAGYEMQKNISIQYKESSQLDHITTSALKAEIYDIVKVDYFIDMQSVKDSLRNECLKELKKKMQSFEIAGLKFDNMDVNVSDDFSTIYPPTKYFSYQSYARPSFNAAKKKQSLNETPKVVSRYYNQQDYSKYDIVINPVVVEPVAQLSYSIVAKYIRKRDEKMYNIITSAGEIKQLSLR